MKKIVMKRAWYIWKNSNNSKNITDSKTNNNEKICFTWTECLKLSWLQCKSGLLDFNDTYKKFNYSLKRYSYPKLGYNKELTEEIVMDCFIKVYKNLHSYDPNKGKVSTWIFNILNRLIIDYYRSKQNKKHSLTNNIQNFVDSSGNETMNIYASDNSFIQCTGNELLTKINKSINDLPEKYRTIANLYFLKEYSYNEIEKELNISLGTIKSRIFKVKSILQSKLQNEKELLNQ